VPGDSDLGDSKTLFDVGRSMFDVNIASKRHKKHKNKISGHVNSMCYNEQKLKFRLFTNPSMFIF
jgi:hypothetical protein